MISLKAAATAVLVVAIASSADAGDDDFLHRLIADINAKIDAAIVARPPKLVPPKKVLVHWRLAKLGSVDLGAPLVAMTAADLDGDGDGELYAVTSKEVVVLEMRGKKLEEIGRVAFAPDAERAGFTPGRGIDRAMAAPRDVVGTAIVDGAAVIASVSSWTRSLRVHWSGKTLVGDPGEPGFALCPGEVVQLAPGRNYFGDAQTGRYGAACKQGLVDAEGHPLRIRAELSVTNRLDVAVERCVATGLGCTAGTHYEYPNVGIAFAVGDVDRDGTPEVIYAAAGAPGDPDILRIHSLGDDEKRPKLKKQFAAGGIAGIAITDLDHDGIDDAVAAVRLVGSSRADLWRLE